jgi:lysozyme
MDHRLRPYRRRAAGQSITAKHEKILRDDLAACGGQVEDLISVPLSDCQYAALVGFVFNAGAGALRSSTLRRRLNAGDYDCVPSELAKWVKATDPNTGRKVSLAGLVRRRAAEGELWLCEAGDDAFRASPDMPQRVEADERRATSRVNARRSSFAAGARGIAPAAAGYGSVRRARNQRLGRG